MAFFYIDIAKHKQRIRLLDEACQKMNIEFRLVEPDRFDYTNAPRLGRDDFLYRGVATHDSVSAPMVEKVLLNDEVITFYQSNNIGLRPQLFSFVTHTKLNIPMPKTIWSLTRNVELLRKYVEQLGGFPVVVKVLGSSKGRGVIKVDSWQGLVSVVDYLLQSGQTAILREFVHIDLPAYSYRAVVLGEEVFVTYRLVQPDENDFRSNAGRHPKHWEVAALSEEEESLMVRAVRALGVEFGAVDFVRHVDRGVLIFEVNLPFYFVSAATKLHYDLPAAMVLFLKGKQQRISAGVTKYVSSRVG